MILLKKYGKIIHHCCWCFCCRHYFCHRGCRRSCRRCCCQRHCQCRRLLVIVHCHWPLCRCPCHHCHFHCPYFCRHCQHLHRCHRLWYYCHHGHCCFCCRCRQCGCVMYLEYFSIYLGYLPTKPMSQHSDTFPANPSWIPDIPRHCLLRN